MDSADTGDARRYAALGWPSDTPAAVVNAAVAEFCASGEPALLDSLVSRAWLDLVLGNARTPWRFVEDMRAVVDAAGDDVVMMVRAALAGVHARELAVAAHSRLLGLIVRTGLADLAWAHARLIDETNPRCWAFTSIGRELWQAGDRERAMAAFEQAAPREHPDLVADAVAALLELGGRSEALGLAQRIDDEQHYPLVRVVKALARHGHLDDLRAVVARIHSGHIRDWAYSEATLALAEAGAFDAALEVAAELRPGRDPADADEPAWRDSGRKKAAALARLAVVLAPGRPDVVAELTTRAEAALRQATSTQPDDDLSRVALSAALTRAGRFSAAVRYIGQRPPAHEPQHLPRSPWVEMAWSGVYWHDGGVWHEYGPKRRAAAVAARQAVAMGGVDLLLAAAHDAPTLLDLLRAAVAIEYARAGQLSAAGLHAATVSAVQGRVEANLAIAAATTDHPATVRRIVADVVALAEEAEKADGHIGSAADIRRRAAVVLARAGDTDKALGLLWSATGFRAFGFREIVALTDDAGALSDLAAWDQGLSALDELRQDAPEQALQALRAAAAKTPAPLIRALAAATDPSTVDELLPRFDGVGRYRSSALTDAAEELLTVGRADLARRVVLHALIGVPGVNRLGPACANAFARCLARTRQVDRALILVGSAGGPQYRTTALAHVVLGLAERDDLGPATQIIADAPTRYGVEQDQLLSQTAGLLRTHGLRDASRRLLAPFGGAIEHDTGTSLSLETAVALVLEQPDGDPSTVAIPGSKESAGAVLRRHRNPELLERLVRADRLAAARAVARDDTIDPYDDGLLPGKTHRAMDLAVIAAAEQRAGRVAEADQTIAELRALIREAEGGGLFDDTAAQARALAALAAVPGLPRDDVLRLLRTALHHSLSWNRYAYFGILAEALPAIATLDDGALLPRVADAIDAIDAWWRH